MNGAGAKLVRECGCGVTARAEDENQLYSAVEQLMKTPKGELEAMGARGRKYCEKHFDRDELITKLEGCLDEAIKTYRKK